MGTLANSEDPDEMRHNHQGLHCLLDQMYLQRKKYNIFWIILPCDPSIYTMNHPDLAVSNFMGNSIGPKRVKWRNPQANKGFI